MMKNKHGMKPDTYLEHGAAEVLVPDVDKTQNRQGDVLLAKVNDFLKGTKKHESPELIIAIGEVQGHSHRLEGKVATYDLPGEILGIEILKPTALVHGTPETYTPDAHKTQQLAPGKYVRILQHEWDPQFDSVPVID